MNRVLKYAWYQVIMILAATVWAAVSVGVIVGYFEINEFNALIPLAPLALVHFYRVFFPLKAGEIDFDERDQAIMSRATKISFMSLFYVFAAGCLIPVGVIGNGTIHVMYLGWLFFVAAILFRIIWSVTVILQYGRIRSDETEFIAEGDAV